MKKLLFFGLFLAAGISLNPQAACAQGQFAPIGATWYHDMAFGVFHSRVVGDTAINGISCRSIVTQPVIKNPTQRPDVHGHYFFVYSNADTVFIYNDLFQRFTPLYVFNVNGGDTLCLPALRGSYCDFIGEDVTDSTFCIVIDSVRMKTWDNVSLKTVYSHPVQDDSFDFHKVYFSYGSEGGVGVYVEKLGGIPTGFLPYCLNCVSLLDDRCQPLGAFRCYHESGSGGLSIEMVDTCDDNATGIESMPLQKALTVYPNPAGSRLFLAVAGASTAPVDIEVYDPFGRILVKQSAQVLSAQPLSIDVSAWTAGVYFIKISNNRGLTAQRKFVKK